MKTLFVACLLVASFFAGAYVDHATSDPGWQDAMGASAVAAFAPTPAGNLAQPATWASLNQDETSQAPVQKPMWKYPDHNGIWQTPAHPIPLTGDFAAQSRSGNAIKAAGDCMPTMRRRGMSQAESAHVCELIISGMIRDR